MHPDFNRAVLSEPHLLSTVKLSTQVTSALNLKYVSIEPSNYFCYSRALLISMLVTNYNLGYKEAILVIHVRIKECLSDNR